MSTVKILRPQPVETKTGIVFCKEGEVRSDLDKQIISSLVGRGLAVEIVVENNHVLSREELEKKTTAELRKLAKSRNILDVTLLTRPLLLDALCPLNLEFE